MGPGVGHVPPGESCHVWRTGGHRSFGTVLSAATSSYTARHGAGGTVRHLFSFLLLSLTSQGGFIFWCVCCWQDNAGNRMRGFKYLLQAAEAGDRSSMIIVARAFDTGVGLSADR